MSLSACAFLFRVRLVLPAQFSEARCGLVRIWSDIPSVGSRRRIHGTRALQQDSAVAERTASSVPASNNRPVREALLPIVKRPDKVKETPNRDKYNLPIVQRWYLKDYKRGKHLKQMYIGLGEHTGGQYYGG